MSSGTSATPFIVRLLAVALLGVGSLLLIAATSPPSGPVYSVSAVRAGLVRSPGLWVGRAVRVHAVAGNRCVSWMGGANPTCISWWPALLDPSASTAQTTLPLRGVPRHPLLAALGRLPLVSRLVPAPQTIRWGALATYRVRLRAASTSACDQSPCYAALLLDAAP
jgi:hypothetical protein